MSYYGLYSVMFIAAVAVMACADAIPAENGFTTTISDSEISQGAAFNSSLNALQVKHRLRTDTETVAGDGDDSFEDRGIGRIGFSFTGLKTLTRTAVQKIKGLFKALMSKMGLTKQKKIDNYFKRSVLKAAKTSIFATPEFQAWTRFADQLYKKSPGDADIAIVTTLTTHYGDTQLRKMLEEASKTEEVATRLLKSQVKYLTKSADDVFKLIKLDGAEDTLFQNPMAKTWISQVSRLDEKEQVDLTWSILKAYYKDEDVLSRALFAGKNDETTRYVALKLRQKQLKRWRASKKTPDEVSTILGIDAMEGNLLEEPGFNIWVSFVMDTSKNPYQLVMEKLKARYPDERTLALLFATAKINRSQLYIAALKDMHISEWVDQHKTAKQLFVTLQLHEKKDEIFKDALWETWLKFVKAADVDEQEDVIVYEVLKEHYGDIMPLVNLARRDENWDALASHLLIGRWIGEDMSGADALKDLTSHYKGEALFLNMEIDAWVLLIEFSVPKKSSDKFRAVSLLKEAFGNDETKLAEVLASAKRSPLANTHNGYLQLIEKLENDLAAQRQHSTAKDQYGWLSSLLAKTNLT